MRWIVRCKMDRLCRQTFVGLRKRGIDESWNYELYNWKNKEKKCLGVREEHQPYSLGICVEIQWGRAQ